jgi:hypothetical protein
VERLQAASPFKLSQDLLRKRRIKIVRDLERPHTKAERSRAGWGCGDGPHLGDGIAATNDDEVLSGLDPVQQSIGVPLELLEADPAHAEIVAD